MGRKGKPERVCLPFKIQLMEVSFFVCKILLQCSEIMKDQWRCNCVSKNTPDFRPASTHCYIFGDHMKLILKYVCVSSNVHVNMNTYAHPVCWNIGPPTISLSQDSHTVYASLQSYCTFRKIRAFDFSLFRPGFILITHQKKQYVRDGWFLGI